jgi:drug/metabolite transporter (DMT)-like permease
MSRRHLILLVVGVTAVSFSAVFVRLADAPALGVAFYRCAFASAILVPLGLIRRRGEYRRITAAQWRLVLMSGVVLAAHFATWISSLSFTTVAAAAVLVQAQPIFVALLGGLVGERPTKGGVLGMAVAIAGAVVISSGGFTGDGRAAIGDLLAAAPKTRVVVMSGFAAHEVADRVIAAGASAYLEKGLRLDFTDALLEVLAG